MLGSILATILVFSLGFSWIGARAYDEATVAYEAAVALDPGDDDALHNLALSYIVKDDREKALPLLRKLVERMPGDAILCASWDASTCCGESMLRARPTWPTNPAEL